MLIAVVLGALSTEATYAGNSKSGTRSKTSSRPHCPDQFKQISGEPSDPYDSPDVVPNQGSSGSSGSSDIDSARDYGTGSDGFPDPNTAW